MNNLPGEPAYEGLAKKEVKDEMQDEYEDLVAKKLCDACQPPECKHKLCPKGTASGCPCFAAKPFDLWLKNYKNSWA